MTDVSTVTIPDLENRFTGLPPIVEYIDGVRWKLRGYVTYKSRADEISTVRNEFVFDWASIPRPLQWILPPAGDGANCYGIAALFHDWLYEHKKIYGRTITRKEADDLFLEIMLYTGVNSALAHIMWSQVRMWGLVTW